jgi:phosphoribosylanthranilate isomerase
MLPSNCKNLRNGAGVKVKICGITRLQDALRCEELGAHALGFIFHKDSPRYIPPEKVAAISNQLGPFIAKVGVFVNETADVINRIVDECQLTMVQLHGEEPPKFIAKVVVPVIKGFRINRSFDFSLLHRYEDCVYLLDAYSGKAYGGTGQTFNWRMIPYALKNRIILAGGISTANIEQVFTEIRPAAVDLSSALEKEPGIKDTAKLDTFFRKYYSLRTLDVSHNGS